MPVEVLRALPTAGGPHAPEWEYCAPLVSALDQPGFASWLDGLPAVRGIGALLDRVASSGGGRSAATAPTDDQGHVEDEARIRAQLLETACLHCHVLAEDGVGLRLGPTAGLWTSSDLRVRTWFRAFVVGGAAEVVVRTLPGRGYHAERASSRMAEVVAAAVGPRPWSGDQVAARGDVVDGFLVLPEVQRGLDRLRWLGLLDTGPVLVAPPRGTALLETLARGLVEQPVPEPRHPDSRVTGPTYEVEVSVDVAGEHRTRLVRVSGSSSVSVLTDLAMTVFGLREEGRTGLLTGMPLPACSGEAGLLTAAGADRTDPWTLAVGDLGSIEDPETGNAVVSASRVSVRSLVARLGERWELPLHTWGGVAEDPVLQLRVVATASAEDSHDLVFPSCLGGTGDHLALDVDEQDDDASGAPFDLDAVEALVARFHRGQR